MEKGIKSKCIHVSELLLSESTHMTTEQETALLLQGVLRQKGWIILM